MSISPHHSDVEWIHESHSRTEKREREGEIEKREERRGREGGRGRREEMEEGERERESQKEDDRRIETKKVHTQIAQRTMSDTFPSLHTTPQQFSPKDALECSKRMCGLRWSV